MPCFPGVNQWNTGFTFAVTVGLVKEQGCLHFSVRSPTPLSHTLWLLCPAPNRRGIKRWCCLTSVCRVHRSGLSREDQNWHRSSPRRTWLTPLSRSTGRFAQRCVGASGGCSGGLGNVLAVGNCCYLAVCTAARFGAHGGRRGVGHIVAAARLQLVKSYSFCFNA